MRTCFEMEERDEYQAARALLIRRCAQWSREHGLPVHDTLVKSALDFRHFSADGRLTFWTPQHVRHFLLDWLPRYVDSESDDILAAPQVLRTLLRFIGDYGLRDPRGASPQDNEVAIAAAAKEFPGALSDVERFGVDKFWDRAAREYDVDVNDEAALARFQEDAHNGLVHIDEELLERLLVAQFGHRLVGEERTLAQLPVSLPSRDELEAAARDCAAIWRLPALVEWLGSEGRELTAAGDLPAVEARLLAKALEIEDNDSIIDSSRDSPALRLYLEWAKRIRLIRRYRGRLVPVAKAAPLLNDPLELWRRAFETVDALGGLICAPESPGTSSSMLDMVFVETLPDVLNSLYSLPEPMPVLRLEETVWQHSCGAHFNIEDLAPRHRDQQRRLVGRDLARMWDVLVQLGAVEFSIGIADEMFSEDLVDDDFDAHSPFDPDTSHWLAEELTLPGKLVQLSDLATAILRERMLAEGREAGLIGELADAEAGEMLSVVTQHYPPRARTVEVDAWLSVHDCGVEELLDVARRTPLRSRAAAILDLMYDVEPDAIKLLRRIRSDPSLAPAALVCLVENGTLELLDLTEPERQLLTAESSFRLMEMDGPEAIIDGLVELSRQDARVVLDRVLTSGHPDQTALAEFRDLVVEPMARRDAARPMPPLVPPGRLGATRRERYRRGGRN